MLFAADGAKLLKNNCATCHLLERPIHDMIPTLKAPIMKAVVFHVKLAIKDKAKTNN